MNGQSGTYYETETMMHGFLPHIMGTRFDVVFIHPHREKATCIWNAIRQELTRLDAALNRFRDDSEVGQLNLRLMQCEKNIPIGDELWAILMKCSHYHHQTMGLFDVTLGHWDTLTFHNAAHQVSGNEAACRIDLGGFAKGYALQRIRMMLQTNDVEHAFIDFGNSSILGMGHHPYGDCWKVSLPQPDGDKMLADFELRNQSLSTSGNTRAYCGHIVHPKSGEHNCHPMAATVLAPDPLDAEILSTVWMIANEDEKQTMVCRFQEIQATVYKWNDPYYKITNKL